MGHGSGINTKTKATVHSDVSGFLGRCNGAPGPTSHPRRPELKFEEVNDRHVVAMPVRAVRARLELGLFVSLTFSFILVKNFQSKRNFALVAQSSNSNPWETPWGEDSSIPKTEGHQPIKKLYGVESHFYLQ